MLTGPPSSQPNLLDRILHRGPKQLALPLEIKGERGARLARHFHDFTTGFAPKLGAKLLMRVGVPMVAATTPFVISQLSPEHEDDLVANLLVGSALGGAWGAFVGAAIPRNSAGLPISRLRSAGGAAAGGVMLAPAVALVSKYVGDWLTSPLRDEPAPEPDGADAPDA